MNCSFGLIHTGRATRRTTHRKQMGPVVVNKKMRVFTLLASNIKGKMFHSNLHARRVARSV